MPYTSLKNLVGSAPPLTHKFLILVYGIKFTVKNSMSVTYVFVYYFLHFRRIFTFQFDTIRNLLYKD